MHKYQISYNNKDMLEKKIILGVGITNATTEEILEYIIRGLERNTKKYYIVTPNPEILVLASRDFKYKNILNRAKIAVNDGIGVTTAGKILNKPLKERLTGVDLLESLCRKAAEKPITVGFLGGRDGVAEKTSECLVKKYPGLKVAFAGEEWPAYKFDGRKLKMEDGNLKIEDGRLKTKNKEKIYSLYSTIKKLPSTFYHLSSNIDILFVALGAPKQEIWISNSLDKFPVKVLIGVGGAFDYISGKVSRAPLIIRKIGFEWLFRLLVQPWRLKRQLALLEFAFLVFKEKIALKKRI